MKNEKSQQKHIELYEIQGNFRLLIFLIDFFVWVDGKS